jgi:hypothetical protein
MGLYDTIIGDCYCPFCGEHLNEMQTKFFEERCLEEMTLKEFEKILQDMATKSNKYIVGELHDFCNRCKRSVSINIAISPYNITG